MVLDIAIILALLLTSLLLWSPWLRSSITWRAMTTPLASIIGSGFLVLGPILDHSYGKYAPLAMFALCAAAYLFGAAIRYNMHAIDLQPQGRSAMEERLETAASWSLGFAYIISVAYYLNLFGAFGVNLANSHDQTHAKLLTSAVFAVILVVGWTRGFKSLERMEYVSVSAKLAIIAGLLLALAVYVFGKAFDGGLVFNAPEETGWPALTLAFGLIITVQGFETSRYLGATYDRKTRIRSMLWAQLVTTAIYLTYTLLIAYIFQRSEIRLTETAIIDMMVIAAPILPVLLVAAALAAQFSAAVADTGGAGGLVAELTGDRLKPRAGYLLLTGIGLALTWSANVFEIISYASRAFALYYAIQSSIAAVAAMRASHRLKALLFALLTIFGMAIVMLGRAVEA